MTYFGDGATEEGVFHESMNLAAVHGLTRSVRVREQSFLQPSGHQLRQPSDRIGRYGEAHRVKTLDRGWQ